MSFSRLTIAGEAHDPAGDITPGTAVEIVINAAAGIIIDLSTRAHLTYRDGSLVWPNGARLELDADSRNEIDLENRKGAIMARMVLTGREFLEQVRRREAEAQAARDAAMMAGQSEAETMPIAAE
ncbi:hypothetical protein AA12717_3753 [Gluconacetobacter sacchari DSM 12717]|uniref:Uncharacterized protein n=2 Tax=Gluconacetobacter sacchari TaxID=92759 RepID=A0A7W4I9Y4_9PROT|nr:hypothetical protein [Gluconacetobacter sacchari]MBB2158988.1 hypothetical protein [Gluconacetobacter sacchari]GBQ31405.1 hypothetical protein AA12717_3753 [Gluconacetobacter sacchari DSM 12717]